MLILNDNPDIFIELSSHTDDRQTDEYNLDLSYKRARSAVTYIVQEGVDAKRVTAKGYGESKLLIQNAQTEEEHQRNRRTEFKVLSYNPREKDINPVDPDDLDEYDRFFLEGDIIEEGNR